MSLAEDLVTAAAQAIREHVRPEEWAREVAQLAAVAVLNSRRGPDWRFVDVPALVNLAHQIESDVARTQLGAVLARELGLSGDTQQAGEQRG